MNQEKIFQLRRFKSLIIEVAARAEKIIETSFSQKDTYQFIRSTSSYAWKIIFSQIPFKGCNFSGLKNYKSNVTMLKIWQSCETSDARSRLLQFFINPSNNF